MATKKSELIEIKPIELQKYATLKELAGVMKAIDEL